MRRPWLRAAEPGQAVAVTLHLGDPQEPTPFQAELTTPPGSGENWTQVELPWDLFAKPDWYGPGGVDQFDSSGVVGVSFDFSAEGDSRQEGRLWVDDLSVSAEDHMKTLFPVVTVEEPEEEGGGGICPFSTLSLPLAGVGIVYWRRSKRR